MNRLCIVGRVIADPELRTVGEKLVALVPVSVNRPYKKKDAQYPESDVFRVEVWGKQGETLVNHVAKGTHIWATGRLEMQKIEGGGCYVNVRDGDWGFSGAKLPGAPATSEEEAPVALPF